MPFLDLFIKHNIFFMLLARYGINLRRAFGIPAVIFASRRLEERQSVHRSKSNERKEEFRGINPEDAEKNHEDLLDRLLRAKVDHPDTMTDNEIKSMSLTLLFAGGETT